jgi:hypothetical protein
LKDFRRLQKYALVWAIVAAVALVLRYTAFAGTRSDDRFLLAAAYMMTVVLLMTAHVFESSRLARAARLRGRGVFGRLRGWMKTSFLELALDEPDEHTPKALRDAVREYSTFRRWTTPFFVASAVIVALLIF